MSDDFCLIHGYEFMRRRSIFDKIAYFAECERRRHKGGPTVDEPGRPYCKDDQTCCDYCCGN